MSEDIARPDGRAEHEGATAAPRQQPQSPRGTLPTFAPVPRLRERSNGWSPQTQLAFIEALADTGSVKSACRRVNRSEVGAYLLRRHPDAESFRAAWQAALDLGMQRIEDVAMERALNGVEVPVYSYGKIVGQRTVYNDRLLMFMLRNRAPERFCEGKAKGMNAVGKMELDRHKKQWRAEWEAEHAQAAARFDTPEGEDELEAKLHRMHENWFALLAPRTRAAYCTFRRLERADREGDFEWLDDPDLDPDALCEEIEAQYERNFGEETDTRPAIWRMIDKDGGKWTPEE